MYFLISTGQLILLLTSHLVATLILFIGVLSAIVFLVRKPLRRYKPIDIAVFDSMQSWPNARRNRFMLFITSLGKHQVLVPANLALIIYFAAVAKQTWLSIRVLAVSLSSLVLMLFLKWLFGRQRPLSPLISAAKGLSFPSGHAIMSVAFYGIVIYWIAHAQLPSLLAFTLSVLLVILILLIGFSRVYLRVHYASDVLAGFIIGLVWLFIALLVVQQAEVYARPI